MVAITFVSALALCVVYGRTIIRTQAAVERVNFSLLTKPAKLVN